MRSVIGLLVCMLLASSNYPLHAYGIGTHREIARRAAEVSSLDQIWIGEGAVREDAPFFRVVNHFYNPLLSFFCDLPVDIPSMADSHDIHYPLPVIDPVNYAVVSHANAP